MRIIRGKSPFSADKTHLHHLFIELGFSHWGTTISIITINILVVLCWFLSYKIGLSIDIQLYIVVALGILITFGFYPATQSHIRKQTKLYYFLHKIGLKTQTTNKTTWKNIQKFIDQSTSKEIRDMYK